MWQRHVKRSSSPLSGAGAATAVEVAAQLREVDCGGS